MKLPAHPTTLLFDNAIRDVAACRPDRPLDPAAIVWLWEMSKRVTNPDNGHPLFARAPIACGNAILYPISFQALHWLIAVEPFFPDGDLVSAAFACVHSDGAPHAILLQTDRTTVVQTVDAWENTLSCEPNDLRAVVARQTGFGVSMIETDPAAANSSDTSAAQWGELLSLLAGAYRIHPWDLVLRPFRDIELLLSNLPRLQALHAGVAADPARRRALNEFFEAVRHIKEHGVP